MKMKAKATKTPRNHMFDQSKHSFLPLSLTLCFLSAHTHGAYAPSILPILLPCTVTIASVQSCHPFCPTYCLLPYECCRFLSRMITCHVDVRIEVPGRKLLPMSPHSTLFLFVLCLIASKFQRPSEKLLLVSCE